MSSEFLPDSEPRVAIMGSTGLLGSKLVSILNGQGYTILQPRRDHLFDDLKESNPTHIINCIGSGMDIRKNQSSEEIWNANFEIPFKLLQLAEVLRSNFINIGSILEKVRSFSSPYIDSKRKLTLEISHLNGRHLNAVSILTPIVFGLDQEHVLISEILNSQSSRNPINLESPGAIREFLHIEDLARFIVKLLNTKTFGLSHFEIGTGTGYRLSTLCDSALEGLVTPAWVFTPKTGRTNEYAVIADTDYAIREFGFQIDCELGQWLKKQVSGHSLEKK